jgi:hypothetical protein
MKLVDGILTLLTYSLRLIANYRLEVTPMESLEPDVRTTCSFLRQIRESGRIFKTKFCSDNECPSDIDTHQLQNVLDILTLLKGVKMRMAIVFSALAAFGGKSSSTEGS